MARFLVMYDSIKQNSDKFQIFAFCMDDRCYQNIKALSLDSVISVKYSELEEFDNELLEVKKSRSLVEYYFTCTPAICNYVFSKYPNIELLTYLDSDLLFFSSPEIIFHEIGDKSIAIVEHRFSKYGQKFIKLGIFNVAWITYRRDEQGLQCLKEYREQCLDWCFDYLDGGKYADQKYLDFWPEKYSNLIVIKNKGVNLAPWNIGNYSITKSGDSIFVDEEKLVFYHFAGLKQFSDSFYTSTISSYYVKPNNLIKSAIYSNYIEKLKNQSNTQQITRKTINPKYLKFSIKRKLKELFRIIRILIFGDLIKA